MTKLRLIRGGGPSTRDTSGVLPDGALSIARRSDAAALRRCIACSTPCERRERVIGMLKTATNLQAMLEAHPPPRNVALAVRKLQRTLLHSARSLVTCESGSA